MSEDSKKKSDKKKYEPKEQRKPRQSRNQAGKTEKTGEIKSTPKVTAPQKPVYEDPGPDFYKNLKRETEEIIKITEAENAKYKKKEIQSNWAKYEMPIESYEDVEEQDVGADYEKLIQGPLTSGGHFQFKHEKSWDASSAPSLYDKYFDISMDTLSIALNTVPFYERNNIDQSLFSESDLLSMNNRASKYKIKYFNDKTFSTVETEAQERIINSLKEISVKETYDKLLEDNASGLDDGPKEYEVNLGFDVTKTDRASVHSIKSKDRISETDFDDEFIFNDIPAVDSKSDAVDMKIDAVAETENETNMKNDTTLKNLEPKDIEIEPVGQEHPVASKINPVIESPEDLEKWLDDFLDS